MPYPIPPSRQYRLPTDPHELALLFTDQAEEARRLQFNRRWGLPCSAVITEGVVRSSSILIQEGHHLVENYPLDKLLFLTLTFKSRQQAQHVSKAFNDINRRLLGSCIEAWIKVVDVHQNGRDHIHALGIATGDIRTGTNLEKVRSFLDTVKAADNANGELRWAERRALRDATTTNFDLHWTWNLLDAFLPRFGFGWVYDAMPVIQPRSIPGYLRTAYLRGRWHDARHGIKKSRRVSYSSNLNRKFPGGRIPRSQHSIRNERVLLAAFGLNHRAELRELVGRSWGFIVLDRLPKALHFREPLDVLTPQDLARRILTLCTTNHYFRSRLEPLLMNLMRVASSPSQMLVRCPAPSPRGR